MNDSKVKKQIIDKIKESNSVLVALNNSPTVDELSAALGLTLAINKIDKHATAVFSGDIPTAISFLEPEKTFENSVLSLQDFIIALDKDKADHLRYKVDGDMVKIFITPYRTTIDEGDLEFSQGDYNVDFVVAIGVQDANSLDKALQSHGQILQDATVASIELGDASGLGSITWSDKNASSYCEILASLVKDLSADKSVLDEQISTALLTGIVAATDRFSNAKTSSRVMTIAADLMAAGANQQLIAVQLEQAEAISAPAPAANAQKSQPIPEDVTPAEAPVAAQPKAADGELDIRHDYRGDVDQVTEQVAEDNQSEAASEAESELNRQLAPTAAPALPPVQPAVDYEETPLQGAAHQSNIPQIEPSFGGTLNATTEEAAISARHDLERDQNRTILSHDTGQYMTGQPSYQSPLSAASDTAQANEPHVRDIFADTPAPAVLPAPAPSVHDLHVEPVESAVLPSALPPLPSAQPAISLPPLSDAAAPALQPVNSTEPTLAEIDAQNRSHEELLGDVHAVFNDQPAQTASTLPPLPPLPPMPDMSTLPPLPGATPAFSTADHTTFGTAPGILAEPLGSTLPPAPAATEQAKADPGQFKIPGMS